MSSSQTAEGFSLWVEPCEPGAGPRAICCITNRRAAARRRRARGAATTVRPCLGGQRAVRTGAAGRGRRRQSGWGRLDAFDAGELQRRPGAPRPVVARLDGVDFASGCGPHRRQYRRRRLVRLPGGTAARTRHRVGAGGAGCRRSPTGCEALLAAADHRSVGASTAVFTALGLMAAYSWRERHLLNAAPGAALWPAVRRRHSAGMAGHLGRAHRCHGPSAGLRGRRRCWAR